MCARACDGTQRKMTYRFWGDDEDDYFWCACVFCVCVFLRQYGFLRTIAVKRNIEFGAFSARLDNTYPV